MVSWVETDDGRKRAFLTSSDTSPLTIPDDWNSLDNRFEAIGPGADGIAGSASAAGIGGGGGAYASKSNFALTPGDSIAFSTGISGSVDAYVLNATGTSTIVQAAGSGTSDGASRDDCTGDFAFSGGNGAAGSGLVGGGGGGAAGPNGPGTAAAGAVGGDGGSFGTGGDGSTEGNPGSDWIAGYDGVTGAALGYGAGGGGSGGGNDGNNGLHGGLYGAGGGGGAKANGATGGAAAGGLIVITYRPVGSPAPGEDTGWTSIGATAVAWTPTGSSGSGWA